MREVRSVILACLGGDAEIRTEEGRTELGHQFLAGVGVIAKALASERARRPLGRLQRRVSSALYPLGIVALRLPDLRRLSCKTISGTQPIDWKSGNSYL